MTDFLLNLIRTRDSGLGAIRAIHMYRRLRGMFKIETDPFQVFSLKHNIEGVIAPIYIIGLPDDVQKLEKKVLDMLLSDDTGRGRCE